MPTAQTVWSTDAQSLTPANPVTLTWANEAGLTFQRTITVDDDALFTIEDTVLKRERRADHALSLRARLAPRPAEHPRLLRHPRGLHRRPRRRRPAGMGLRRRGGRRPAVSVRDRRDLDRRDRRLGRHHRQVLGHRHRPRSGHGLHRPLHGGVGRRRARVPGRCARRRAHDRRGRDGDLDEAPVSPARSRSRSSTATPRRSASGSSTW